MSSRLPRAFWMLWTGTLINMLGGMVEPFLVLYLHNDLGLTLGQAGWVVATLGLGAVLAQFLGGIMADRLGRLATMAVSTVAQAAFVVLLAHSRGALLIVAAILVGLTREMYRPAVLAVVGDIVPTHEAVRANGLIYWAVNLGWAVALPLGGIVAAWNIRWIFYIDAATALAFGVIVVLGVPETRSSRSALPLRAMLVQVLHNRALLGYLAIVVAFTVASLQGMTTLAPAMSQIGLGPATYGLVMAVNGGLIALTAPLVSRWTSRWRLRRTLGYAFTLVGIGYGLTALASSPLTFAGTVAVWTLGEIMAAGALPALVNSIAPEGGRGLYSGLYGVAWSLGLLLAPIFGTQLLAVSGPALWFGTAALALSIVLLLGIVGRSAFPTQPEEG